MKIKKLIAIKCSNCNYKNVIRCNRNMCPKCKSKNINIEDMTKEYEKLVNYINSQMIKFVSEKVYNKKIKRYKDYLERGEIK